MAGCNGGGSDSVGGGTPTPTPPPVTTLRADLIYSYYGSNYSQIADTHDHVNAVWVMGWGLNDPMTNTLGDLKDAETYGIDKVILSADVVYRDDPEPKLRAYFDAIRAAGLLKNIVALYPQDEPDVQGFDDAKVQAANALLRKVMADYPELKDTKLAVIYGPNARPGVDSYDWVGFDDYNHGAAIFTNGEYAGLKGLLRPDQRILVVPGGALPWAQDPTPFFNAAESDPQVIGLVPFVWFDYTSAGSGIDADGMKVPYCLVGKKIKDPTNPNPTC